MSDQPASANPAPANPAQAADNATASTDGADLAFASAADGDAYAFADGPAIDGAAIDFILPVAGTELVEVARFEHPIFAAGEPPAPLGSLDDSGTRELAGWSSDAVLSGGDTAFFVSADAGEAGPSPFDWSRVFGAAAADPLVAMAGLAVETAGGAGFDPALDSPVNLALAHGGARAGFAALDWHGAELSWVSGWSGGAHVHEAWHFDPARGGYVFDHFV